MTTLGGLLWLLANVCGKTCTIYNSALFYASTRQLEIPPSVIPSGPPDIPTVTGNQLNKQRAANGRTTAVGVRNLGMTVSTGPSPDMPYINSATSQRTELQLSPRREVVVGASPARSDRGSCSDQVYSGPYMTTSATTTHQH
ncbi:uncharacterized protein LOC134842778 [Symsagittifera roscoffensis]|uniref:uncharacterized protein LOC134842778 n=1 Tax=Symsagittifera roscoffensis TaxID=84072 RepID=UPI00307BACC9